MRTLRAQWVTFAYLVLAVAVVVVVLVATAAGRVPAQTVQALAALATFVAAAGVALYFGLAGQR
ncbi:MAG TPA: hypothetical protein VH278_02615, partial [Burkholderiaceae bacterium]|nr:hypothetical protein [Burkholderiaceae bacterium]